MTMFSMKAESRKLPFLQRHTLKTTDSVNFLLTLNSHHYMWFYVLEQTILIYRYFMLYFYTIF